MSSETLISLQDIHFSYFPDKPILSGFSLTLAAGQRLGLAGPNGCGKTTVLSILMGLLRPSQGRVEIFGQARRTEREFQNVRPKLGFVFQDANDQLFCPTVADDIAFGPLNMGASKKDAARKVEEILSLLGMNGFGGRISHDLSGGEKRLIALGTALALDPRILVLDEPTTFLDAATADHLESILESCGLPSLIVSHDTAFLARVTDTQMHMGRRGKR